MRIYHISCNSVLVLLLDCSVVAYQAAGTYTHAALSSRSCSVPARSGAAAAPTPMQVSTLNNGLKVASIDQQGAVSDSPAAYSPVRFVSAPL